MAYNSNDLTNDGSAVSAQRLAYRSPKLTLLGSVRTLTESGSGAQLEPTDSMGMCNSAATKMC